MIAVFLLPCRGAEAADGVPCQAEPTQMTISYGDQVVCDLSPVGDIDTFRFAGAAGDRVSVQAARHAGLVPCAELFDPGGMRIGANCSIYGARVDVTLAIAGIYTIRVGDSGNDETGGYAVDLQRLAPQPVVGEVAFGSTLQATLSPVGDVDLHTFSGLAGDTVTLVATRQSGLVPCIELYDPDGLPLGTHCSIYGARLDRRLTKTGTHAVRITDSGNDETGGYSLALQCIGVCPPVDTDGDGMSDACELQFGLDPANASDAALDPDGDGATSLEECRAGTHPRGFYTGYFAEGATGGSLGFATLLATLNPGPTPATVLFRFLKSDVSRVTHLLSIGPLRRQTTTVESLAGLAVAEFSTIWESDQPIVADRTMSWDATRYGSHSETSVPMPSQTWYLAEGATHSGFQLFYLLQNPDPTTPASVVVEYLLPAPRPPILRAITVAPRSRLTVWVNMDPALADTDVSATLTSSHPIIVERAMYLGSAGHSFAAGHESAGVATPSANWFLAEGATGSYFDLFVLMANPGDLDARCDVRFLLPDAAVIQRPTTVPPRSRLNIWVDAEGGRLSDTAVSTTVTCDRPIIAERSMWWPGPTSSTWAEAHNSPGATHTGTTWALAEGEVGGANDVDTFILLANTSASPASVRVTLLFEDGTSAERTYGVGPNSRFNVWVRADFPLSHARRFGAIVESLGATPAQLVVERAMYSNANGVVWAAGTNALATRLP